MLKHDHALTKASASLCAVLLASSMATSFAYANVESDAGQVGSDIAQGSDGADQGGNEGQENGDPGQAGDGGQESGDPSQGGGDSGAVEEPSHVVIPDGWHQDESTKAWSYYRDSKPVQGWLLDKDNWYLLGEDGIMKTGLQEYKGSTYYLNPESGSLPLGAMRTGWNLFDEGWRCFSSSGHMEVAWLLSSGAWYWLDPETGIMATGVAYCNGVPYHFASSGAMTGGWTLDGDTWYLAKSSGELLSGWQKQGDSWYWLDPDTFAMKTGWFQVDDTWYYANASGAMQTGWVSAPSGWYYLDSNGAMVAGDWRSVNGHWYYLTDSGVMQTGWFQLGDTWYYANDSGAMETGWAYIDSSWYYFFSNGAMATAGWQYIDGSWYYLREGGSMKTGWLNLGTSDSAEWYYLKPSGAMQTGWAHINDEYGSRYYYFGYSGLMTKNLSQPERLRQDLYNEGWYISPLLADAANTREERIEAMIATAYEYLGDTYRACYSQAPGGYVDCSGLAMQGLYAAGFDPDPISPKRHSNPAYEYESRNMWNLNIPKVSYADRQRGDLIYYDNGYGTIIHVAIYLGNDQVIEAWPPRVTVWPIVNSAHPHVYGVQRPF